MLAAVRLVTISALAIALGCSDPNGGRRAEGGSSGAGATGGPARGGASGTSGSAGSGGTHGHGGISGHGGFAGDRGSAGHSVSSGEGGTAGGGGAAGSSHVGAVGGTTGSAGAGGAATPPEGVFMLFHNVYSLFRAVPDETAPPVEIASAIAPPETIITNLIPTPDGRWAVYSLFAPAWGSALHVVPTFGDGDSVRITREPTPGRGPLGGSAQGLATGHPEWNPSGTRIAFQANYQRTFELYTSTRDGALVDQQVSGQLSDREHVETWYGWDGSGSRLLYLIDPGDGGASRLYTGTADGTENQLVASAPVVDWPAWDPSGSRIAHIAAPAAPHLNALFTTKPDGSDAQRVNTTPVTHGEVLGHAWSPDGKWIAYWGDLGTDGRTELYVARPDGSENKKVSGEVESGSGVVGGGTWNPMGTRVAYRSRLQDGGPTELFTNDVQGADNRRVRTELQEGYFVANGYQWSPDGGRLAYVSGERGTWANLYTATSDGSDEQIIGTTSYPNYWGLFRWSPDGRLIAYSSPEGGTTDVAIRTTEPDGANSRVVTLPLEDGERLHHLFSWSPDSTWIAYITLRGSNRYALHVARADGTMTREVYEGFIHNPYYRRLLSEDFAWVLIED